MIKNTLLVFLLALGYSAFSQNDTIQVLVLDSNGLPVPNAIVSVNAQPGYNQLFLDTTNASGFVYRDNVTLPNPTNFIRAFHGNVFNPCFDSVDIQKPTGSGLHFWSDTIFICPGSTPPAPSQNINIWVHNSSWAPEVNIPVDLYAYPSKSYILSAQTDSNGIVNTSSSAIPSGNYFTLGHSALQQLLRFFPCELLSIVECMG